MTREETKVKTFDILHFVADNAGLSIFEAIEKAYNMGVSEQEVVLDKIRAEIKGWQIDIHDNENDADKHDFVFERIYEIIDEYKAESEDKG